MERAWKKFYPKGVPLSLKYPEIPVFETLREAGEKYPENTAIIFKDVEITYKKLDTLTDTLAAALHNLGLRKGDRFAFFLPNTPQLIMSFYGGLKAGATLVPCNNMLKEKGLKHQLKDSGAETIITLKELYPVVKNVKDETDLKNVIITSLDDWLYLIPSHIEAREGREHPDSINFLNLLKDHEAEAPKVKINPKEDVATLQYTGGTTGVPKGAMLTHYNLIVNQVRHIKWCKGKEGKETSMIFLPMYHIYGLSECMASAVHMAAKIVLIQRFYPELVLKAINKYKPTFFYGVPTAYIAILSDPYVRKCDFSSIRLCLSAAAPLPAEVRKSWKEVTGIDITEGWGLTEASPNLTYTPPGVAKPKMIGVPAPDTVVKVVDVQDGTRELPPREHGELIARGPQIMKAYWNMPEETKKTLRNGWLYTGDIGYMDIDGCFFFIDRKKDLINAAGFKVWPTDVEETLYEHPAVEEVAVVGIPDQYRGESVKAFVVLHDKYRGKITEETLIEFCRERVAVYKAPRVIEFRDSLPKTHVGKILRRVLREEEWERAAKR